MSTLLSTLETSARLHLNEATASFWSSAELVDIANQGYRDLWRDIVDLKQEHFLTNDAANVSLAADTATLTGVPTNVHKVYLIEPRDVSSTSSNRNLHFQPLEYNHARFSGSRSSANIDPQNGVIYYSITGAGAPTDDSGATTTVIYVAPKVTSAVTLRFVYVPTLALRTAAQSNPIPGESDNAIIAWIVAFARAKEREDRSPDPAWLAIYATEKQHLLQSLGLRQYHEPTVVDGLFDPYWS